MIKSIRLTLLGMLTLLLSTAVQLSAEPTINGPSGLVTMPTAESLEYQQFNFALDYKMANQVQERFYSFNMGMFKNVELGITGGSTPTEGVFVNAKYFLISDNGRFPLTFAVGVQNLTSIKNTGVYLVVSKKFQGGIQGHLGFNAIFNDQELDPTLMGGAEYFLNDRTSVVGDFTGKQKKYTVNVGFRFALYPDWTLRVNLLDLGNSGATAGTSSNYYSIGISHTQFL